MTERIVGGSSLHETEKPELCPDRKHFAWRTVFCDGSRDVIECSRCGKQEGASCNFDDDFS